MHTVFSEFPTLPRSLFLPAKETTRSAGGAAFARAPCPHVCIPPAPPPSPGMSPSPPTNPAGTRCTCDALSSRAHVAKKVYSKFSKVSVLVHLLYKVSVESTFLECVPIAARRSGAHPRLFAQNRTHPMRLVSSCRTELRSQSIVTFRFYKCAGTLEFFRDFACHARTAASSLSAALLA